MEWLDIGGRFLDVVFKRVALIKRCETMWKSVGSAKVCEEHELGGLCCVEASCCGNNKVAMETVSPP